MAPSIANKNQLIIILTRYKTDSWTYPQIVPSTFISFDQSNLVPSVVHLDDKNMSKITNHIKLTFFTSLVTTSPVHPELCWITKNLWFQAELFLMIIFDCHEYYSNKGCTQEYHTNAYQHWNSRYSRIPPLFSWYV